MWYILPTSFPGSGGGERETLETSLIFFSNINKPQSDMRYIHETLFLPDTFSFISRRYSKIYSAYIQASAGHIRRRSAFKLWTTLRLCLRRTRDLIKLTLSPLTWRDDSNGLHELNLKSRVSSFQVLELWRHWSRARSRAHAWFWYDRWEFARDKSVRASSVVVTCRDLIGSFIAF